jgi:hypothetical protein
MGFGFRDADESSGSCKLRGLEYRKANTNGSAILWRYKGVSGGYENLISDVGCSPIFLNWPPLAILEDAFEYGEGSVERIHFATLAR